MRGILIILFVALIGTNFENYYSEDAPISGIIVLSLFCLATITSFKSLKLDINLVLWCLLVLSPLALMSLSNRTFSHGVWASELSTVLVFFSGVFLGSNAQQYKPILFASLSVILCDAFLNFYELFIENNVWSIASGRSAGWYVNPNLSAANICLFSILYFFLRDSSLRKFDFAILGLIFMGVFATFSRSGYVLFLCPLIALALPETASTLKISHTLKFAASLLLLAAFTMLTLSYVTNQLHLSSDAEIRLAWLSGEGQTDESIEGRETVARYAWDQFLNFPLTGNGVRTSLEMVEGPHNMYIAIALDMGTFALALYVTLILSPLLSGFQRIAKSFRDGYFRLIFCFWLGVWSFASHNITGSLSDLLGVSLIISILSQSNRRAVVRNPAKSPKIHRFKR